MGSPHMASKSQNLQDTDVLKDESIVASRRLAATYQFKVGKLTPIVTVRIWENYGLRAVTARYEFETSHFIKTSIQSEAFVADQPFGKDQAGALRRAVQDITLDYAEAIKSGEKPSDSWLLPNRGFRYGAD